MPDDSQRTDRANVRQYLLRIYTRAIRRFRFRRLIRYDEDQLALQAEGIGLFQQQYPLYP